MDLLYDESGKLLISGKFKYFHYNPNSKSLEILDGHFSNGNNFSCNFTPDKVCILKINDLELKYDEINGQITTRNDVIGSSVILEQCDNISIRLKYSDKYFDEELKLVEKEKAVKIQSLCGYQLHIPNHLHLIPSSINEDSEGGDNLVSIEGLPIAPNSQKFQIILNGDSSEYAIEFEGELVFSVETYDCGDEFQLVEVNRKLTLYNLSYGYLGRGTDKDECKSVMYYKEIPDNLVYLEKYQDNGMYLMRCGGGVGKEDDYLYIDWVKASCGFSGFTKKKEKASIFQFAMCCGVNSEEVSYTYNPVSKL